MKNSKFFPKMLCIAIISMFLHLGFAANPKSVQDNHLSYSAVTTYLDGLGYSEVSVPSGFVRSFTGGVLHYYIQTGTDYYVAVYAYGSENELPQAANDQCDKKASSYVSDGVVRSECKDTGNECKVKETKDSGGKTVGVEMVCCG